MLRKARSLESLSELGMSPRAIQFFKNNYSTLSETVWHGRRVAYALFRYPETSKRYSEASLELAYALRDAGLIRFDMDPGSFSLNRLRRAIYGSKVGANYLPCHFEDFGNTAAGINYRAANERYENFQNPTDEQLEAAMRNLRVCLNDREYAILVYRFGFNGEIYDAKSIGKMFNITPEKVRHIEARALRKLRSVAYSAESKMLEDVLLAE